MAFQTNVLRGGEWVTETVDVNAVIKAGSATKGPQKQKLLRPQHCGLLTKTIVESPLYNFILPVKIRSGYRNDVAFIGDHSVEIRQLQEDGKLRDILKKNDFGSRIRNASVVSTFKSVAPINTADVEGGEAFVKKEEDELEHQALGISPLEAATRRSNFPPQLLLLVLECGDCVFLHVRPTADGELEFVSSRFRNPKIDFVYPGFHLAVEPGSRYMALACTENFFAVYELEPFDTLVRRHLRNEPLNPVRSFRGRTIPGVIHKMEFLYPGNDSQVILLMILVQDGKSKMVIYEWEVEHDLAHVLSTPRVGHRMPTEDQMPLFIVPLTIQSAFILVSAHRMTVCTNALHSPNFSEFVTKKREATPNHHGQDTPLWTAWARPSRLAAYFRERDCLYLAREDGLVMYIDADNESTLTGAIDMDPFDTNISGPFACLNDQHSDVLVIGGDSSPGGIYLIPPRGIQRRLSVLPNWAPTVDFVTTDEFKWWNQEIGAKGQKMSSWQEGTIRRPDRIFATSCRGKKGCVTEYRNGLQANIALDLDCETLVRQAWLFHVELADASQGFYVLLSMPDRSEISHVSQDLSSCLALDPETNPFDLSSRTLTAVQHSNGLIIQITEQNVNVLTNGKSFKFSYEEMLSGHGHGYDSGSFVSDASVFEDWIAIATHTNTSYHIHIFQLDSQRVGLSLKHTLDSVAGEVTCLSLAPAYGLLVGLWADGQPLLGRCRLDAEPPSQLEVINIRSHLAKPPYAHENIIQNMEPISSLVATAELIVFGTRSGEVITISDYDAVTMVVEKFGSTSARLTRAKDFSFDSDPAIFVCDGQNVILMSSYKRDPTSTKGGYFSAKHKVWPIDDNGHEEDDPNEQGGDGNNKQGASLPIDYAVVVDMLTRESDTTAVLFVTGTRILLAEMQQKARLVPRHMPVQGTPMKMIYSHYLQCLVVAITRDNRPTLVFLDPTTGEDLGQPSDKTGTEVPFIAGLGKEKDRIFGLAEWEYKNEGRVYRYLLVTTRESKVLVVSAEKVEAKAPGSRFRIRYWTRYKIKDLDRPVYSVLGLEEGMVFCVGNTLHWQVMDTADKKLNLLDTFDLASPATTLRLINGKIVALTNRDSLEIVDSPALGGTTGMENSRLRHADAKTRNTVHMMEVAGLQPGESMASIMLVADRDCQVAGLWVPWQLPGKDCETIFEAELPASIRKFRRGRTRPTWMQAGRRPRYGRMASTLDDADILGMSLDGSMQHFTLLKMEAWRLLRFIQNVAARSEEICPFTFDLTGHDGDGGVDDDDDDGLEFDPEPKVGRGREMHIDGDMMQRCLDRRALERLLERPAYQARLRELLDEIDDGRHVAEFEGAGIELYFGLAYRILEYFLEPPI